MKLTLERQIPLGFTIAIFLLAITIFFAYRSMISLKETLRLEKHTQQILLQLDEIFILMLNAETASRGFLLTKDETILEPFNQAKQNIGQDFERLEKLVSDNPNQIQKIA